MYIEIPAGFVNTSNTDMVCLLHKAVYGLKQALRQWHSKINHFLVDEMNFTGCSYEPCVYFRHQEDSIMVIALYVDDLLIAGSNRSLVDSVKAESSRRYKMKDLGPAQEFLGILHISHFSYASRILALFGMSDANAFNTCCR